MLTLSPGAFACEELLRSPLTQVFADQVTFSITAKRELSHLQLSEEQFLTLLDRTNAFAIPERARSFVSVVFEDNPRHQDRGYVFRGEHRGNEVFIFNIHRSAYDDEKSYFQAVANLHHLKPQMVAVHRAILNCHSVVVKGWVQAKLWLKHHLELDSVSDLLDGGGPLTPDHIHFSQNPRYIVSGIDHERRRLRAVVEDRGGCPTGLVTAFEVAR